MQPVKYCPNCKTPAVHDTATCVACGHVYGTLQAPAEPVPIEIPPASTRASASLPLSGATHWSCVGMALVVVPALVLVLIGGYIGYLHWRTPGFVGKWTSREDSGLEQAFYSDGTGQTSITKTGAMFPFHWRAHGQRVVIEYDPKQTPSMTQVGTKPSMKYTWSLSERGRILTITPTSRNMASHVFQADDSP